MPAVDAVIVAAIVAAFVIFAGVLAWVEHQTRDLPAVRSPGKAAGGRPAVNRTPLFCCPDVALALAQAQFLIVQVSDNR